MCKLIVDDDDDVDRMLEEKKMNPSDCTFAPHINDESDVNSTTGTRRRRSLYDLSIGESNRRETNRKLLKLKLDQDEEEECLLHETRRPKITATGRNARSKICTDDGYVEQLTIDKKTKNEMIQYLVSARIEEEMKECTFAPEIKTCPGYIQSIAKSVALAKFAKKQSEMESVNSRRDWR